MIRISRAELNDRLSMSTATFAEILRLRGDIPGSDSDAHLALPQSDLMHNLVAFANDYRLLLLPRTYAHTEVFARND